jgi:hypothetical protein
MAARYGWIITADVLDGRTVSITGPRDITAEQIARLNAGEGAQFRLKDDDGEIYFEGRFVGDEKSEDAFGPLDDYGLPDSGCTSIEYFNPAKEKWQAL